MSLSVLLLRKSLVIQGTRVLVLEQLMTKQEALGSSLISISMILQPDLLVFVMQPIFRMLVVLLAMRMQSDALYVSYSAF